MFDLDGTLININSITQLMGGDWEAFHEATFNCPPNDAVVEFARRCQKHSEIIVLTGKPERFRKKAIDFLRLQGIMPEFILMRPLMNDLSDVLLKPNRLRMLLGSEWRDNVLFVVEDRDKMVNEWRRLGVTCFQCAESLY